jgi:hypothetical protein
MSYTLAMKNGIRLIKEGFLENAGLGKPGVICEW